MKIEGLYRTIEKRRSTLPKDSYTASLFRDGIDQIIQKVGEEATEVVIALKNGDRREIIREVADLSFHILVALSALGIKPGDVLGELNRRRQS